MRIVLWGTRGSIAVPGSKTIRYGGNTTCVEMDLLGEQKIVIDAGTGIRELGDELLARDRAVDIHLLVTHIHWDHILGFPFFAPIYIPETRIIVDGNIRGYKGLKTLFENRMGDGFFPVKFDELKANITFKDSLEKEHRTRIGETDIDSIRLHHPGGGLGFRFREESKTFVFLTDNELSESSWEGCNIDDYVRFCKGADLLIHDCQYTESEIVTRRGWGHTDTARALALARDAEVKRLILYHHDPNRTDEDMDQVVAGCREWVERERACFTVEGAVEGEIFL
ncbi:MAG: MBL fold metallo-hydrolase [Deltaproteobacteria bacterium]|nr:MBL fold metallo-hydrolase [Deltaproteobacteria bacterium]